MSETKSIGTPDFDISIPVRPSYTEPYEPPESLWQLIKSVANERELDVIKSIIGESLVETSIDLHNEIDSLLEIWRDYRNETTQELNQIDPKNTKNYLPEPPNIRETLKKEINFFMKQMREQYKEDEQFRRQIATNNHNLNVINYVLNSALTNGNTDITDDSRARSRSLSERPNTAIDKRTGNETPLITSAEGRQSRQRVRYRSVSRASSLNSPRAQLRSVNSNYDEAISVPNTLSENLEQYVDEDKINCMQIDEIAEHLRELLQQECDVLLKDIEFIYECIEQERDYRESTRGSAREPSLNELKEERKRLENDLMTGRNVAKISKLPSNPTTNKSNRSINSPLFRASPPPSSASSTKSKMLINEINTGEKETIVKRSALSTKKSEGLATPLLNTPSTAKTINTFTIKRATSNNNATQFKSLNKTVNNSPKSSGNLVNNNNSVNKNLNGKATPTADFNIKPIMSRTNSASSIASSVASSVSSETSSKLSAAQKFRRMVLDSRND